jgi:hypothetical protein
MDGAMNQKHIHISRLVVRTRGIGAEQAARIGRELPQKIAEALATETSLRGAARHVARVTADHKAGRVDLSDIASQVRQAVQAQATGSPRRNPKPESGLTQHQAGRGQRR